VFVSCTSTTSSLDSVAQWSLDGGRAMMDSCKAVAPAGARGGVDGRSGERLRLEMGWRKEVEVTSGVCAQGAFFGLYQ
jgi:hypothetical protein